MKYFPRSCLALLLLVYSLAKIKGIDELQSSFEKSEKNLKLGVLVKEVDHHLMLAFAYEKLSGYYRYRSSKMSVSVGHLSFNNYLTSLSVAAQAWRLATVNRQRAAWSYKAGKSESVKTAALRFFPQASFPLGMSIAFFDKKEDAQGWISQLHLLDENSPLQLDALLANSFTDGETKTATKKLLRSASWQPLANRYYIALSLYFKDENWRARSEWSLYSHEYGFSATALRNHLFTKIIDNQDHKLESSFIINYYQPHYRSWQGKKPLYSQQYATAFWYRWQHLLNLSYKIRLLKEKQKHYFLTSLQLATWKLGYKQYLDLSKRLDWGHRLNFSFLQPSWRFSSALELHFAAEQFKKIVPQLTFFWKLVDQSFTLQSRLSLQLLKDDFAFRHTFRWRRKLGVFDQSLSLSLKNWPPLTPEKPLQLSFRWRLLLRLKHFSFDDQQSDFENSKALENQEIFEEQEILKNKNVENNDPFEEI